MTRHHQYHTILMEYGFGFTVDHDLMTGLRYQHATKPIVVVIKDNSYTNWFCENLQGTMYYEEHFSVAEWDYMFGDQSLEEAEVLGRMLHILVRVRPRSLNLQINRIA